MVRYLIDRYSAILSNYFDKELTNRIVETVIKYSNEEIEQNDVLKNIPASIISENFNNLIFNIQNSIKLRNRDDDYVPVIDNIISGKIKPEDIMTITKTQWDPFVNKATADKIEYNDTMSKPKSTVIRDTCTSCKMNNQYYWNEMQLRGADEGTSIIYLCTNCLTFRREN